MKRIKQILQKTEDILAEENLDKFNIEEYDNDFPKAVEVRLVATLPQVCSVLQKLEGIYGSAVEWAVTEEGPMAAPTETPYKYVIDILY